MVESEAYELTEDEMLGAVVFAHREMQPVIDLIVEMAEDAAREAALAAPNVAAAMAGKPLRKVIVVPNRIVNVVV
jgi:polyribonucleotide nucleotidyltransferase